VITRNGATKMYYDILNAWKAEKSSIKLQKLPNDFYLNVAKYLHTLRQASKSAPNELSNQILNGLLQNSLLLTLDIYQLRVNKILDVLKSGENLDESFLASEERSLLKDMRSLIGKHVETLSNTLKSLTVTSEAGKVLVKMVQDVPSFVGIDLATYGPFKAEDVALIPKENAESLIRKGVAVKVDG